MTVREQAIAARAAELLTIKEFAALAGLHPEYVREQCRRGRIVGAIKVIGTWRIDLGSVLHPPCKS